MSDVRVLGVAGSLRLGSLNRALLRAAVRLAPSGMTIETFDLNEVPLYNGDVEAAGDPPGVTAFKDAIRAADAVLFVTPEYNRSIPGALKNAIDWASRPYGQNAFARKPSGVIGASPGSIGTAVGQQSLRAVLGFCNAPQMTSPEAYIQFKPDLIDDQGNVSVDATREFLRNYMSEYALFVQRVLTVLPREG